MTTVRMDKQRVDEGRLVRVTEGVKAYYRQARSCNAPG
jgi:hypothetical protein